MLPVRLNFLGMKLYGRIRDFVYTEIGLSLHTQQTEREREKKKERRPNSLPPCTALDAVWKRAIILRIQAPSKLPSLTFKVCLFNSRHCAEKRVFTWAERKKRGLCRESTHRRYSRGTRRASISTNRLLRSARSKPRRKNERTAKKEPRRTGPRVGSGKKL